MTIKALLEPFQQAGMFKKILPTLMIQSVVFCLLVQFSRTIPNRFDTWVLKRDETEESIDKAIQAASRVLLLFAYDLMRHYFSENIEVTANILSKEIHDFYMNSLNQLESLHDELLKKNKKNTEAFIKSISNLTLDAAILSFAFYDTNVKGASYYGVMAYFMMRSLSVMMQRQERLATLPVVSPETELECISTQNRQRFFSVPSQISASYLSYDVHKRAQLMMILAGICCAFKSPDNIGLYMQVFGSTELFCEHLFELKEASAKREVHFQP
ncbi:MAG: hypothetical protein P1U61_06950 [Legionellaceae bacterium]|nr:hypothetical protein [Legionellaceae bacterium]